MAISLSIISEEGLSSALSRTSFLLLSDNRVEFYELLADYLAAGIDMVSALEAFLNQQIKDGKSDTSSDVIRLQTWLAAINEGGRLCDAIRGWVPERERMLIEAYESASNLSEGLQKTVRMMESSGEMRSIWMGAIAYPAFLTVIAGGLLHIYGTDVIPNFASMYPVEKWTGDAARLAWIADIVVNYWAGIIALMLGLMGLVVWCMPKWTGTLRVIADKMPPFSFFKLDEGAAFMVSLNAMLQAGTPVLKAVDQLRENASPWLEERLEPVVASMNGGTNIATAMKEAGFNFPDKRLISLMELHADKKTFVKALPLQVDRWIARTIKGMRKKAKVINFMSMGAVAALAGWIYLALGDISSIVTKALH